MRWLATLVCVAMAVLTIHDARAETRVEVVGTWPAGETVTLRPHQKFYLHLRYTSDHPVRIWAEPYFDGKQATAGSNSSRVYPTGSGEALGWFFLMQRDGQVDEVRIRAGDGSRDGTRVVATYPVSIADSGEETQTGPQPNWVTDLGAIDAAAQRADYEKRMNTPLSTGDIVFFDAFMLAMFGIGILAFAWPVWGVWRWRGGWRIASAVPLAIMAIVVLRILLGTAIDRTSHNLWPFEIIMIGGLSVVIMLVLLVARFLTRASRHP